MKPGDQAVRTSIRSHAHEARPAAARRQPPVHAPPKLPPLLWLGATCLRITQHRQGAWQWRACKPAHKSHQALLLMRAAVPRPPLPLPQGALLPAGAASRPPLPLGRPCPTQPSKPLPWEPGLPTEGCPAPRARACRPPEPPAGRRRLGRTGCPGPWPRQPRSPGCARSLQDCGTRQGVSVAEGWSAASRLTGTCCGDELLGSSRAWRLSPSPSLTTTARKAEHAPVMRHCPMRNTSNPLCV